MTITLRAPAKLTLGLRVTGVRPDGYHLIDSEMVSLDIADLVSIDPGGDGITVSGPYSSGIPTGADNLVSRALAMAGRRAAVHIDKRVPSGGGLGGGSSDAAAVLRWAGIDDPAIAARIGADVGFCLAGGRARVRGIGEIVEPLPAVDLEITLVIPPLHCSTPAVYRAWDELGGPRGDNGNDLEPAAVAVEPEMARWRDRIGAAAGARPLLAGSGATWYLVGAYPHLAELLPDGHVVVTRTDRPG